MIRSMTGYGRGEQIAHDRKFTVEIKSVNHRYLDINIKVPRSMNYLEDAIRKNLMKDIFRGKTDVYIGFETFSSDDISVKINEPLADAYVSRLRELSEKYGLSTENELGIVARFPDLMLVEKEQKEDNVIWETLLVALNQAKEKFVEMRTKEGEALKVDILKKAEEIMKLVNLVKERSPLVVLEYKEKLENRLKDILQQHEVDQQRLATEIAIFADKGCVDEEITRLESHLLQLKDILNQGGQVGRKLDFLIQEMNREANTIASKSNNIEITKATISLKSEVEKIREQIQNME